MNIKNPYDIKTYITKEVGYFNRFSNTQYDGRVLRDTLIMSGITKSELRILKDLYQTICWGNSKFGTVHEADDGIAERYQGRYVNLVDEIRKLPQKLLKYHINTIQGMIGSTKYGITE